MIINQIATGGGELEFYEAKDATGEMSSESTFTFSGLNLPSGIKAIYVLFYALIKRTITNGNTQGNENLLLKYDGTSAEWFTIEIDGSTHDFVSRGEFSFEVQSGNLVVNLSNDTCTATFLGGSKDGVYEGFIIC